MKETVRTVGFLWKCFRTLFLGIQILSEQGQPARQKVIDTYTRGGTNPLTGRTIFLNLKSNQIVAFYCEQDKAWWISRNAGDNWLIMPSNKSFLKVIHLVDIVL